MIATLPYKHFDLKKHVAAIHSANKLSLVQRKIANALLFNAYHELSEKQEHQIHIRVLCELIGYNSNELNAIKKALVSLISTVVEWNLIDKDRLDNAGTWNASAIIADASISGSICTYSYSQKMRQLLFRPEMYGRLNMQVQAQFNSSYGLVLYENCVRYQNIHETPWFDITLFRKLMGVDEGKYPVFKDFRKRVIDIAIKEVNQHSGLYVGYILKKLGRTPVAIKFSIEPVLDQKICSSQAEKILHQDFAFSKQQAASAVATFGEGYIEEKITVVKNSTSYKKKSIQHLAGYMQSALVKDYQESSKPRSSGRFTEVSTKAQQDVNSGIQTRNDEVALVSPLERKMKDNHQEKTLEDFYQLASDEQDRLLSLFLKTIRQTIYETLFVRDHLENTIVAKKFIQFLKKNA